jgi:hypothetical protein
VIIVPRVKSGTDLNTLNSLSRSTRSESSGFRRTSTESQDSAKTSEMGARIIQVSAQAGCTLELSEGYRRITSMIAALGLRTGRRSGVVDSGLDVWSGRSLRSSMKIITITALSTTALLSACASGPDVPIDYMGSIRTQVTAPEMAACIGQATAVAPVTEADGLIVNAPSQTLPRRYTISRTKSETVVMMQGEYSRRLVASDAAALKCALRTR